MRLKTAAVRAAIVLIPSYSIAFLTEKMVYVIPMLAAASFFAAATDFSSTKSLRRLDENEAEDSEAEDSENEDIHVDLDHGL